MNFSLASEQLLEDVANKKGSLRILLVSARYSPYVGGTETHVHEVGRRMKAAGHDVTVLTTDPSKKLPTTEERDGLPVRRVAAYPADKDYYFAPGLYSIITQGHWDVVHLQGYHTLVAPLTMLAAIASKTPFVVSFHSGGHSSPVRTSARGFQRLLLRPLLNQAAKLICVSQFEADFFTENLGINRDRFVVIPNGSQLPKLTTEVKPSSDTLIVSPGRLERYKGHQHAIEAFPKVLEKKPNARLRIVGTGPYDAELRQLAAASGVGDRIEIGGIAAEDRQGMAALLTQASLVVLFSEYEAHPVAVMEALSLGCSVLVTDTSGLGELARKGWVKAIPLNSTSDEVAKAILHQLDEPVNPSDITLPTWDDCARSLLNTYQGVINRLQPTG
ncbi:MAG: glycosyltransferase family 4 protein [Chloroflexota bacterium]